MSDLNDLQRWMDSREGEHLEFKEAKARYDFELLVKYCAALANEGGGRIILGVTNEMPRQVVGSAAFDALERTRAGLIERLHLRIIAEEIHHPDGRVVVFHVPSRPTGSAVQYKGAYWMRSADELAPMTPEMLRRVFGELGRDYSAEICAGAAMADLDSEAIARFRAMWVRKSKKKTLENLGDEQLLADAELVVSGGITYAALVLFGTLVALGRHLAQAEVIFEYRSSQASIPYQQREEFRQGLFLFDDAVWNLINLRNDVQQFRSGLYRRDIPTFNEDVVREAMLNAVTHRDYQMGGSIFVRQYPRRLEIVSPGGFLPGLTPANILDRQSPRNRRLAEACARCGLVERSGQGVNMMFEQCILESKSQPDFSDSDEYQVSVTLPGEIQDENFLRFLEKVGDERLAHFTTQDLLLLDLVYREQAVPDDLRPRLKRLADDGVIEAKRAGHYMLSRQFYSFVGQKGVYTQRRGLDRETNKALLLKHIQDNAPEGSPLRELLQVLPSHSRGQIQRMLQQMQRDGQIRVAGTTSAARWYPAVKESIGETEGNH
jgi:ATP-dependent DNA helicase RecG